MAVQNQVVSKMVLFSSVLTPGSTTTFGTMTTLATEMTFSSISMKNILGELYDQYDTFNISLNSVTIPQSATTYGVGNNTNIMLFMSGPAFKTSNTYSNLTRTSQNAALVGNFQLPTWVANSSSTIYFGQSFVNTFGKFEDYIDITLSLRTPTGTLQAPTNAYPLIVYNFTIVGVDGSHPAQYVHSSNELITIGSRLDGHNGQFGAMGPPSNAQRPFNERKFYL